MQFTPDSYARVVREFNPCHATDSGEFTTKGQGKCSGGTLASPIDRYAEAHKRMTSVSRETGREVAGVVNEAGQIVPIELPVKVNYYYAMNDPEHSAQRAELAKQGLQLGDASSAFAVALDRADLVHIHTHPQNSPFSPNDIEHLLRSENPAVVVFGADGTSWYELRKKGGVLWKDALRGTNIDLQKYDVMLDEADKQWIIDSSLAVLKARGISAKPMMQYAARGGGVSAWAMADYVTTNYFGGDREAAKAAAVKVAPMAPYRHRVLREWLKSYAHLLEYRSSWDEKTKAS